MNSPRASLLLFVSFFWILWACENTPPDLPYPAPVYRIDPEFQEYVDRFVDEGRKRGVTVDVSRLNMEFEEGYVERDGTIYCGYANNFGTSSTPDVDISTTCWEFYDPVRREILIFHELGHAILDRAHVNTLLPSLGKRSIMHPSLGVDIYSKYTLEKREWYLDELFNQDSPVPMWGKAKSFSGEFWSDEIDSAATGWEFLNVDGNTPVTAQGEVTSDSVFSPQYALEMNVFQMFPAEFASWQYVFSKPAVPIGSQLILKAQIKTEITSIDGIEVLFFAENDTSEIRPFFTSSLETYQITGSRDWAEYQLPFMAYFPSGVDRMIVRFQAPGEMLGKVWIDDVRLELWE